LPPNGHVLVGGSWQLPYERILPWGEGNGGELVLRPPWGWKSSRRTGRHDGSGELVRHLPLRYASGYASLGWEDQKKYTEPELDRMCACRFAVNHAGRLRSVRWALTKPIDSGGALFVLVRIGDDDAWNKDPDATNGDRLWGEHTSLPRQNGVLEPLNAAGESPTIGPGQSVEVRFYFDLSYLGEPYATRWSLHPLFGEQWDETWTHMLEIDRVDIEILPEPTTF
jgi:hypothetical protein